MLEVKNLTVKFGKKVVIEDISFELRPNEVTIIVGLNGTGKSTLLKAIMNLIPHQKGEVLVDGQPFTFESYENVGFVSDHLALLPHLTIKESLELMETFYDSYNSARAEQLLTFFRLNPEERVRTLSKGNQAKLNLLLSLVLDTSYILLDEPFAGIDVFSREELLNVFTTDIMENKSVLMATHDIHEIENLADRIIMLKNGHIINDINLEEWREEKGQNVMDLMQEVYEREIFI
ncbi:ATP-binding cassette domain-containing protein [Atopobacter phocae]|uniref:ABC transporter ATP-binding protein n=1 Tax=Atopobacter phocae TaxID=136492 RepID=UPI00046F9C9D|nr:ABC transporter ATP-binding protein [Atopobacter phocae]